MFKTAIPSRTIQSYIFLFKVYVNKKNVVGIYVLFNKKKEVRTLTFLK